ncbi:MAG: cytochrome P450 [Pirellulales bacterium]|nr:cytochrome P450 [Pirellulales bacterium]
MTDKHKSDWNPKDADVLRDPREAYDAMRERCPVAYSELMHWSVFRHDDVQRILHDHETFSNAVSDHLSVPGGMDPPEHSAYRAIVEKYFTAERLAAFEPRCREIVTDLVQKVLQAGQVELMAAFALPFAAQAQCAFLGWPIELAEPLIRWTHKNHAATFDQDRKAMSEIAREFESYVDDLIESRLEAGARPEDDVTASLMHEKVWGRPLSHEEVASILRNWTVGEVGTLSASVGILIHYLAQCMHLQSQIRSNLSLLPAAIDEILRLDGPLVANRRVTTQPVEINGRKFEAGERISLIWIAANRDARVFDEPDCFRLDRDPNQNLLYGAGLHVCPGAPLARLEMRVCMEEILKRTTAIELRQEQPASKAHYPASGFAELPVVVR